MEQQIIADKDGTARRKRGIFIILPIILVLALVFLWSLKKPDVPPFTADQARSLAVSNWGDCKEETCDELKVSVLEKDGVKILEAIYTGMKDDSVKAIRKTAPVRLNNDWWTIGSPVTEEYLCQEGRGQQTFSSLLCA